MLRPRLTYSISLIIAFALHMVYAEYASYYILLALLALPVLSLLLCLLAAFFTRLSLSLPEMAPALSPVVLEVQVRSRFPLPLSRISITYSRQNLFTGETGEAAHLYCDAGVYKQEVELSGAHCGRCQVCVTRVKIHDYLGLFALPLRRPLPAVYLSMPRSQSPQPPFCPEDLIPRRMMPKPGGGFAEEHELRGYRDGDAVAAIHWKLSSKLDELIIREPMIPQKQQIHLILGPCGSPEELDSVLGQLLHVSHMLLVLDITHRVECPFTTRQQLMRAVIASEQALKRYVSRLLTSRVEMTDGQPQVMAGLACYVISPGKTERDGDG